MILPRAGELKSATDGIVMRVFFTELLLWWVVKQKQMAAAEQFDPVNWLQV